MAEPRQPHISCYQRGWLRVLSDHRALAVRAVQLSGRRLRIVLNDSLTIGAPVAFQTSDWLALGEVSCCRGEYSHCVAEIELDQLLMGLQEISARQKQWLRSTVLPPSFVVHVAEQPHA